MRVRPVFLALVLVLMLTGCATTVPKDNARTAPPSAPELYEAGRAALASGDYESALDRFRKLEVYFPDDKRTVQAQIETVYAYYQSRDSASAIAAAGRFIRRYPDHPNLDYLYYLRGLARYDQATQEFAALSPDAPGDRPPAAEFALRYFSELIGRYPASKYSEDARNRVNHLRQKLAETELQAARQLMDRGEYANAGLRARGVIENYPDSGLLMDAAVVVNMSHRMLNLEVVSAQGQAAEPHTQRPAAPTPAPAPAAGATGSPAADGELRRADWIARQNPDAYTIQLLSTSREDALLSFVRRHRLQETAFYQSARSEQPWFSLVYGVFTSMAEARTAAEKLPAALRGEKPWIRRMADVQALITMNKIEDRRAEGAGP